MRAVRSEIRERRQIVFDKELDTITSKMSSAVKRTILRGKSTGKWLSTLPTIVNGTVIAPQEFRDGLCLRYAITPEGLPSHCDGCGQKFSKDHALSCKKGGLVTIRHNEIRDELGFLCSQAFCPSAVRDEPLINHGRTVDLKKARDASNSAPSTPKTSESNTEKQGKPDNDERGDLLIRGFWDSQMSTIVDVRITDTDAKSYCTKDPAKVLEQHEREKKKKYLQPCLDRRKHFTPFVVSADGLVGKEAQTFLRRLAAKLALKWKRPYSVVCGYVNTRISIAIIRATHLCLRGSRVPVNWISNRRPEWEDKAGLSLFQS
jgi:hypothetical protein